MPAAGRHRQAVAGGHAVAGQRPALPGTFGVHAVAGQRPALPGTFGVHGLPASGRHCRVRLGFMRLPGGITDGGAGRSRDALPPAAGCR
ncbi:hypothetical protein C9416_00445 [Stenotrophomonas sp. Nf4]|nr:hypothetical protein C9416_00445 [Stenotrophomonas sp. Nf4]